MKKNEFIKIKKILLISSVLFFVFGLCGRIYVISTLSTKGSEIYKIEKEIALLNKENSILKEQISKESSLTTVKAKALAMGMKNASVLEFIDPAKSASAQIPISTVQF